MKNFLAVACCLFLVGIASSLLASSRAEEYPTVRAYAWSEGGVLVIRRTPNLGNEVFVSVGIDGRRVASIGYGHTFETVLSPGRHVLAVLATPRPNYRDWWTIELDVRPGRTYSFTAVPFASQLILRRNR